MLLKVRKVGAVKLCKYWEETTDDEKQDKK